MLTDKEAVLLGWAIRNRDEHYGKSFAYILAGDLGLPSQPFENWEVLLALRAIQKSHLAC